MKILLKNVRLSFPSLFEKSKYDANDPDDKAKYRAVFLIPKTDVETVTLINNAIKDAMGEKYHAKRVNIPKHNWCLQDGDERDYDGYRGNWSLSTSNNRRPTVINRDKSPIIESDEIIYAGCYVNASVGIWILDINNNRRVCCNLHGVQFVRNGSPFGAGDVDSLEDFEALDALTSEIDTYEDVPF